MIKKLIKLGYSGDYELEEGHGYFKYRFYSHPLMIAFTFQKEGVFYSSNTYPFNELPNYSVEVDLDDLFKDEKIKHDFHMFSQLVEHKVMAEWVKEERRLGRMR